MTPPAPDSKSVGLNKSHVTSSQLLELAVIFLRLGTTAFGGPAAHIALMEQEFVRKREWLSEHEYLDMIGISNLVPGPSSTEVAIHIGFLRAGFAGLAIAGICFILPASLMVAALAKIYVEYGQSPSFESAMYGIKPVVAAVVLQAVYGLAKKLLDTWPKRIALAVNLVFGFLGVNTLALLIGSGVALGSNSLRIDRDWKSLRVVGSLLISIVLIAAVPVLLSETLLHAQQVRPRDVFIYFLGLGSVLYGSGYVLLAFLERDLVFRLHWLARGTIFDAIAIGQFTPGPVFTTATFIGYVLAGPMGALLATVGIFLPAFVFVAISGKWLRSLRKSSTSSGFLDGINCAAVALMIVVLMRLATSAVSSWVGVILFAISFLILIRLRLNSALLIVAGGTIGLIFHMSLH